MNSIFHSPRRNLSQVLPSCKRSQVYTTPRMRRIGWCNGSKSLVTYACQFFAGWKVEDLLFSYMKMIWFRIEILYWNYLRNIYIWVLFPMFTDFLFPWCAICWWPLPDKCRKRRGKWIIIIHEMNTHEILNLTWKQTVCTVQNLPSEKSIAPKWFWCNKPTVGYCTEMDLSKRGEAAWE